MTRSLPLALVACLALAPDVAAASLPGHGGGPPPRATAGATPQAGGTAPGPSPSVEDALARLRERAAAARAELAPRVETLLARLDGLGPRPAEGEVAAIEDALAALPPDAAPLLVAHLDVPSPPADAEPGSEPRPADGASGDPGATGATGPAVSASAARRAAVVARALARVGVGAVLDDLDRLARTGSPTAREHAVSVLGRAGASEATAPRVRDRARVLLERLWDDPEVERTLGLLTGLVASSGERSPAILDAVLASPSPREIDLALRAAEATGVPAPRGMRGLLERASLAAPRIGAIARYYARRPGDFGAVEAERLIGLLSHPDTLPKSRVQVLRLLPEMHAGRGRPDWTRHLRELADRWPATRTESRIALALLGDRSAREALLEQAGERIENAPRSAEAWEARGLLRLRLDEPREAVEDFEHALDRTTYPPQRRSIGVLLARARCRLGRLREAHDALEELRLDRSERAQLAADPDFAELAAHPRYGDVLRD